MIRSTPWVDGCCGPMLMIIVSSSSGHGPPVSTSSRSRRLARERPQQLRALVGLRLEPALLLGAGRHVRPRVIAASSRPRVFLERDRHARGRVVLAQRVADPVVGHEDAREVGVAVERDAEQVVDLALGERRCPGRGRRGWRRAARRPGTWQITRMRRLRGCDRKLATTSKRSGVDARRHDARGVDEVVDRGHVEALRELLLVAEERGDARASARGRRRRPAGRASRRTPCPGSARATAAATSSWAGDDGSRRRRLRDSLHEGRRRRVAVSVIGSVGASASPGRRRARRLDAGAAVVGRARGAS